MAVKLETPGESLHRNPEQDRRPDPPRGLEPSLEQSVQRGTRLLATLSHAARAARLEAEVAELQAALAEAQGGDGRRLERWLSKFDAARDFDLPAFSPPTVWPASAACSETALPAFASFDGTLEIEHIRTEAPEKPGALGWAVYLEHSRRRLRELQSARPHALSELASQLDSKSSVTIAESISTDDRAAAPTDASAPIAEAIEVDSVAIAAECEELSADRISAEDTITADASIDAWDLAPIEVAPKELEQTAVVSRPMLSGFSLSLIGHIGLLTFLFMITCRLPDEPASLGSQLVSVAAATAEIELASEFDAPESVELQLADFDESSIAPSSNVATPSKIEPLAVDAGSLLNASASATQANQSAGAMLSAAVGSHPSRGTSGKGSAGGRTPAMSSTGGKFFGAGAGGNFFCYVVDSSGSMRGNAWESAKAELLRSISTLTEKQRFYIVFFAKEVVALPEPGGREPATHGLAATKENIEHARRWIGTVKLDRGGPPNDALALAISREPDAIYLLTDGVTKVDVCGFLREANRTSDIINGEQVRVPVHAIAYHSLDGQQLLRQLAKENDGQFHYVPAP